MSNSSEHWRARVLAGAEDAQVIVLTGPQPGRRYPIALVDIIIGRSPEATVVLDDPQVSRQHAVIRRSRQTGQLTVEDLESRNGTLLKGAPVKLADLKIGDELQVGSVKLLIARFNAMEEQILQRQRLETIGRLTAGLAHDFNNMQHVVLSGVEFIARLLEDHHLADEELWECLSDVKSGSRRAVVLATRLLSLTRSDQQGFHRLDAAEIVREAAQLARRSFDRSIKVTVAAEAGLHVMGSDAELLQLLMNLCLNSRDAMPSGGQLYLSAVRSMPADGGEPQVLIAVEDTGSGMERETKEQALEPFFTTKPHEHTGLGLSIVQQIVSVHGGSLEIESEPDGGTTVRCALPGAKKEVRQPTETLTTTQLAQVVDLSAAIMVVDDEPFLRKSLKRVLEDAGHRVIMARDGLDAIQQFKARQADLELEEPDLVLLDVHMPGMRGEDVYAELKALQSSLPIILMTGHDDRARAESIDADKAVWLHKPFTLEVLLDQIDNVLCGRTKRRSSGSLKIDH